MYSMNGKSSRVTFIQMWACLSSLARYLLRYMHVIHAKKVNQNLVFNLPYCSFLQEKFFSHLNKRTCNILRLDDCGSDPLDEKVSNDTYAEVHLLYVAVT